MKLNEIADNPGSTQEAHARRPRHRLGQGQDRRPRRQGPDRALRRAHQGLRRRPDAAASAPAQARLPQHQFQLALNEVNLGQVQAAIDAGCSTPRPRSTPRRWSRPGVLRRAQGRRAAARQWRAQGQGRFRGVSAASKSAIAARSRRPAARSRSWRRSAKRATRPPDRLYLMTGRRRERERAMVSAAEQLAANLNFSAPSPRPRS